MWVITCNYIHCLEKQKTMEERNPTTLSRLTQNKVGGRNTRTQSRISSRLSGDTYLEDEIDRTKAELDALKEEAESPPKWAVIDLLI